MTELLQNNFTPKLKGILGLLKTIGSRQPIVAHVTFGDDYHFGTKSNKDWGRDLMPPKNEKFNKHISV